jgi:hypothetical protein
MTMRKSPMPVAWRRRIRGSGGPRQIDLFDGATPTEMPAWRELPEETRRTLTSLFARLILEHAQAGRAALQEEAGDDL